MGDSAGGGLALGLALALKTENITQPKDIILLSPWLDVTLSNEDIPKYESSDPILSAWGCGSWAISGHDVVKTTLSTPMLALFMAIQMD